MENLRNSEQIGEQEILVASFGTSYNENRILTIGAIEEVFEQSFPDWSIRRGFTSQMIINHLKRRDGIMIDHMRDSLEKAKNAGVKRLVIQPTLLMDGIEYDDICALSRTYQKYFEKMVIGKPLFYSEDDYKRMMRALVKDTRSYDDGETAICFMGHGTEVAANRVYL